MSNLNRNKIYEFKLISPSFEFGFALIPNSYYDKFSRLQIKLSWRDLWCQNIKQTFSLRLQAYSIWLECHVKILSYNYVATLI